MSTRIPAKNVNNYRNSELKLRWAPSILPKEWVALEVSGYKPNWCRHQRCCAAKTCMSRLRCVWCGQFPGATKSHDRNFWCTKKLRVPATVHEPCLWIGGLMVDAWSVAGQWWMPIRRAFLRSFGGRRTRPRQSGGAWPRHLVMGFPIKTWRFNQFKPVFLSKLS